MPVYILFHDDGVAPDVDEGDKIYSAYITENITAFTDQIAIMQGKLEDQGTFLKFIGHGGEELSYGDVTPFDFEAFDNLEEVELDPMLIEAIDCGDDLKKHHSLFITHLGVVEDLTRTFDLRTYLNTTNPAPQGNYDGEWTFGKLMQHAANGQVSDRAFMKSWIKHWMMDAVVGRLQLNGQTVMERTSAYHYLILPWLKAAYYKYHLDQNHPNPGSIISGIHQHNWETYWDNTSSTTGVSDDALRRYAPFKLTAIVNRMDLRGNSAYGGTFNTGETRFIFTLLNNNFGNLANNAPWEIVSHDNPCLGQNCPTNSSINTFLDWMGMNVIFEYANPSGTICDVQTLAQNWVDLSDPSMTLGSTASGNFNEKLQEITDMVTLAGVGGSGRPNGSALLRIRTNERVFQPNLSQTHWNSTKWELRQFEINGSTKLWEQVPVSNTPISRTTAVTGFNSIDNTNGTGLLDNSAQAAPSDWGNPELINWLFANSITFQAAKLGRHSFPLTMSSSQGSIPFLAATAIVDDDYASFWNLNWEATGLSHYSRNNYSSADYQAFKEVRRHISLNTCQGCHAGENKTIFTQVLPLKYGEEANYWSSTASDLYKVGPLDTRFTENIGETKIPANSQAVKNYPLVSKNNDRYISKVAAFLTGRSLTGEASTVGTWADDHPGDANDHLMSGLYYVNDPTNNANNTNGTFPNPQMRWGYNDLEMRKQKLCKLLENCTGTSIVIKAMTNLTFHPLPAGSH